MMKSLSETIKTATYIATVAVEKSHDAALYDEALYAAGGLFRQAAAHADATPETAALAAAAASVCDKARGLPPTKVTAASIAFAAGIVPA